MATHSGIPAGKIPLTEEPGGLQSTGSQRAGHDWTAEQIHDEGYLLTVIVYTVSMLLHTT